MIATEAGIDLLREIVSAYHAGDTDLLDELIARAAEWLESPALVPDKPEKNGRSMTEDQTPGSGVIVDPKGRAGNLSAGSGMEHDALAGLVGAVQNYLAQGPNRRTQAELEAALQNARRFV